MKGLCSALRFVIAQYISSTYVPGILTFFPDVEQLLKFGRESSLLVTVVTVNCGMLHISTTDTGEHLDVSVAVVFKSGTY